MLAGPGSLEGAPAWRDPELRGDLRHRLSDLVLLEPEQVILALELLDFLLRRGAGMVVARQQLGQQTEDLARLLDPLRYSFSRFSSGCRVHDHPRLLRGAVRRHMSMAGRPTAAC